MVRRIVVAVAVIAAVGLSAPPAHGASGTQSAMSERFVEADWAGPITASGGQYVQRQWGAVLTIDSVRGSAGTVAGVAGVCDLTFADADAQVFVAAACTNASLIDAAGAYSYTYDAARLSSASLRGVGLPAQTCSYDVSFNQVGDCTGTTLDVAVAWTGTGPIQTDRSTDQGPGRFRTTSTTRQRAAVATGTFDGETAAGDAFHTVFFDSSSTSVTHLQKTLALAASSTAGPASAGSAVTRGSQLQADADWVTDPVAEGSGTVQREWTVDVIVDTSGPVPTPRLFASVCDYHVAADQSFTGATCEEAVADSGFTYAIDPRLSTASAHASNLESGVCTFDSSFSIIGCTTGSLSLDARWSDAGPTSTTKYTSSVPGGFRYVDTLTRRSSSATGVFDGVTATGTARAHLTSERITSVSH